MKRGKAIALFIVAGLLAGYIFSLPGDLFKGTRYSSVVVDREGDLLGARTAADGQWRFPQSDYVPERYAKAVIQFEDKHFRWHPGVNPVALVRALKDNVKAGHITSGGSTITMQVIRMSRHKPRTLWQKGIEAILATRLEMRLSKSRILALYASHAPFGGNVVGVEAASWRYFGRPSSELSWAESATLAVLPNSPSSMHPGKNRDALLRKRNRLLEKLCLNGDIDSLTLELALDEPLPEAPLPLPSYAPHLTARHEGSGKILRTSIDGQLQRMVSEAVDRASDRLAIRGIADMAAVVIDVRTGETVAYVGNSSVYREREGKMVDIAAKPRSTGSILKPFLYAGALQEGIILPRTLLRDTPVNLGGFTPQNFDLQFYGAVPAAEALARSLNVPAVHLLREYGVPRFHTLLKETGMTSFTKGPSHYGLSLILGGGEGRLDEITAAYAGLARSFFDYDKNYPIKDKWALWYTFDALKEVTRPDDIDIHLIHSARKAAWKTGTSYGFRDAWAVGVTPEYAVGVWTGNAGGQGVPGLTGAQAAGPVMFDLLNLLPPSDEWFEAPEGGVEADVCRASGHLKGMFCDEYDKVTLPENALRSEVCPYHHEVEGDHVFILPPAMEWYYRPHHPEYRVPEKSNSSPMEFIYPESGSTIYIPRQLDGTVEGAVFQIAHRKGNATVWWHLDGSYIGETKYIHQMRFAPEKGRHVLAAVDDEGNTISVSFTVS